MNETTADSAEVKSAEYRPLYGHTSLDTAYVAENYPWGFQLRTQKRYWLEFKKGKGYRLVTQTIDPRNGRACAPKSSTYSEIAACLYLDENGHAQWYGLSFNATAEQVEFFINHFPGAVTDTIKSLVNLQIRSCAKYKVLHSQGLTGGSIGGVPTELSPSVVDENVRRMETWERIAAKLA